MNEPQDIPEAREAAQQIWVEDCPPTELVIIISTACREYAKKENAFITKCAFDAAEVMAKENAHLRQQLSSLQKECERLAAFHIEDMRVTNASADFHIKECDRLRKENEELKATVQLANKSAEVAGGIYEETIARAEKAEKELVTMTKMRDTYAEQFSTQSRLHGEFASRLEHLRNDVKPLLVWVIDDDLRDAFLAKHPEFNK